MLTLEQKIGQMMVIGWQTSNVEDIIELIKNYNFGNVMLFSRNIKSVEHLKEMCEQIQEAAMKYNGVPAFILTDQEGGPTCRIYEGLTKVPGNMAIGAASFTKPKAAQKIGSIIGEELKSLGINFNLAPVVDINNNPFNPIIGTRAYSDDPALVTKLATEFSQALQAKGVLSTYKHFLGHGNVTVDPIHDLPHLTSSLDDILETEMIPYRGEYLPDAIMAAHILYDKIDNVFPVSISSKIIKGILREGLGYQGLLISDCYESGALQRAFALAEAAVFSVQATVDLILVCHTFGKQLTIRNALIDAVKNHYLEQSLIDTAVKRIIKYKEKYIKSEKPKANFDLNQSIANEISLASITVASGKMFEIDDNTIVVGITNYLSSIIEDNFVEEIDVAKELGKAFDIPYCSINNKNFNINNIINLCKDKKVILALVDSHLTLMQKVLYTTLIQNKTRVMLISMRTPYDLIELSKPECHICLYEYTNLSISSLIKVLEGEEARGKLPVNISSSIGKEGHKTTKNFIIKRVLTQLNQQYSQDITLESVARDQKISSAHLSRLFKKEMGTTFIDFLNTLRINKAKNLLVASSLYLYEIGNLCGFSDANYFSKVFKKATGVSPNEYRNNYYDFEHLD